MTEKERIEYIIVTKKSPRAFDDYKNYVFLIAPIALTVMAISMLLNYFQFDSGLLMLLVAILFIAVGVTLGFLILKRLNDNIAFISVPSVAEYDIDKAAEKVSLQFKLQRIDVNKDLNKIIAITKKTAFSWGEQLTLVFDKEEILINSRPSGINQPFTIMKDRQNIKKLKQIL